MEISFYHLSEMTDKKFIADKIEFGTRIGIAVDGQLNGKRCRTIVADFPSEDLEAIKKALNEL